MLSILFGLWKFWPTLDAGLISDEYMEAAIIDGTYASPRHPLDLFNFVDGSPEDVRALQRYGSVPWWAQPNAQINFMRPLSSAMIHFDRMAFGDNLVLYHAHSLFWWVVLICSVALLLRSLRIPPSLAALAVFIFSATPGHHFTVTWLANRGAFVSLCFGVMGLYFHLRWRRQGQSSALPWSVFFFCLALLTGEWGIPAFAYLAAYELLDAPGSVKQRARALLPATIPAMLFMGVRAYLGYGARNSSIYIDPGADPLRFLSVLTTRLPIFLGDMFFGIPANWWDFGSPWRTSLLHWSIVPPDIWHQLPDWRFWQVALGVTAGLVATCSILWAMGRASSSERRELRWLLPGSLMALVPMAASFPSTRLTLATLVAMSAGIALVTRESWRYLVHRGQLALAGRLVAAVLLLGILKLQMVDPLLKDFRAMTHHFIGVTEWILGAEVDYDKLAEQRVIIVSSWEWTSTFFYPYVLSYYHKPMPRSSYVLSAARRAHDLERTSENSITLSVLGGTFMASDPEFLFADEARPLRLGQVIEIDGMTAEVVRMQSGKPQAVRFTFEVPLEDDSLVFLNTTDRGMRRVELPEVGERIRLKRAVSPNWWGHHRGRYEMRLGEQPDFLEFNPLPTFTAYRPPKQS